jgi:N-methylhydantoinase A
MRMAASDPEAVAALVAGMEEEALGFVRSCGTEADILTEYKIYMRYSGQG